MPPATHRSRRFPTGSAGYSLVELVVVIVVLGVLAGMAGPRFFDQQVFSERGYADELAAALRLTQKVAVASGCPARLVLASGSYSAVQQAAAGNHCNAADATWVTAVLGPDGAAIQGAAPTGTTASPAGTFQFDPEGKLTASPGATVTVGAHLVSLDAGTGFVQVQ